jgi:septum formation protein
VLLRKLCPEFTVAPTPIDETLMPGPLVQSVPRLALAKARAAIAAGVRGIVLAADTVVTLDGDVLGKPADAADARRMLRLLRARAHDVITGIAVVDAATGREASSATVTRVVMAAYDDAAIEAYVATGSPLDKAGAYAIQEVGDAWVTSVHGSSSNVVGLPLGPTRRLLAAFGVSLLPPSSVEAGEDA